MKIAMQDCEYGLADGVKQREQRDSETQALLRDLFTRYKSVLDAPQLTKEQKVGYMLAVCMVDTSVNLGWMSFSYGVEQIRKAIAS